jgi:hypothetical protein
MFLEKSITTQWRQSEMMLPTQLRTSIGLLRLQETEIQTFHPS